MKETLDALEKLGIRVISGAHRLVAGLSMGHTVCALVDDGSYYVFSRNASGDLAVYSSTEPAGIEASIVVSHTGTDDPQPSKGVTGEWNPSGKAQSNFFASENPPLIVLSSYGHANMDSSALKSLAQSFQRMNNLRKRDPFTPACRSVGEKARLRSQRQQAMNRGK